jgi:hypothetical protein
MKKLSYFLRLTVLLVGMLVLNSRAAHAVHFRYATMHWEPTGNQVGEIRFDMTGSFQRDDYFGSAPDGHPQTGDIIQEYVGGTSLNFGDGNITGVLNFLVVAYDVNLNYIIGDALDPILNTDGIIHTYTDAGPFDAGVDSCCRIAALNNRETGSYKFSTKVAPLSGNSSPISTLVPIITVPEKANASFFVPATDPDCDKIRFRLSTDEEAGGGNSPPNIAINPDTGEVTWNTVGLDKTKYWTVQFIVEDLDRFGGVQTQTPVDFLLKVSTSTGTVPTLSLSPPGPITVPPGTPITFTVNSTDPDPGAIVTLNSGGLPIGATTTPVLPTTAPSAVSTTFKWTPAAAQQGANVVVFIATDETGLQNQASMILFVDATPPIVTFLSPQDGQSVSSLATTGLVTDNFGGCSVDRVELVIKRSIDNQYWNGTQWVATPVHLSTNIAGATWSRTFGLPTGTLLLESQYVLTAFAYDKAGNSTSKTITVALSPPPILTIDFPQDNAFIASLPVIKGTVIDTSHSQAGIDRVDLVLQRSVDSKWWDGSQWVSIPGAPSTSPLPILKTVYDASTHVWNTTNNLPSGAALVQSTYTVTATAYAKAGGVARLTHVFMVDSLPPAIAFSSPLDTQTVNNLSSIRGTAADRTGGSGISRVDLLIQRKSDGRYWTGTQWSATLTPLTTTVGAGLWSRTDSASTPMPTGANLTDGGYLLTATAYDRAGNSTRVTANVTVVADVLSVSFLSPTDAATLSSLTSVNLQVNDTASPLASVKLAFVRNSDGKYWSGTNWVTTAAYLNAVKSTTSANWAVTSQLPTGSNLAAGKYTLTAIATDQAAHTKSATIGITIVTGGIAVTITNPANGSKVTSLPSVSGTVTPSTGSGISRVDLFIQRSSDNRYWGGTAWGIAQTALATVRQTNGTWSRTSGLPNGSDLTDDTYTLTAKAYDLSGATASTNIAITVGNGGPSPTPTPSGTPVTVSGRVANSSGQAITNALVTMTGGPNGGTSTMVSNSAGYYTFSNVSSGNYILSAGLSGYTFQPSSINISVNGAPLGGLNFTGYTSGTTFKIYGRIATSSGLAIPNVSVTRTGSPTPVLTNSAGYFTFSGVPPGSYTLTPSKSGYSFTPVTKTATVTNTDVSGQNFIGSNP